MNRAILTLKSDRPTCPYCGEYAELVDSSTIYPHARQDYGKFWKCPGECDAYVGTHRNSRRHAPLGNLANAELRRLKTEAHRAFDPLWHEDSPHYMGYTRQQAYRWLAQEMGKPPGKNVHIGFMTIAECRQVVEICNGSRE